MKFLTHINYMKNAKYWLIFSLVLTLVSVVALITPGLQRGIDFKGGNVLDVQFEQKIELGKLDNAVNSVVGAGSQIQRAEVKGNASADGFLIKTQPMSEEQRVKLLTALEGVGKYKVVGEDNVSGAVSKELTQKAILAIAIAALLQVIYIWIRFDLVFGVTAVLALVHDTIITMGLLALLKVQINASFVAAILTVLGYSMNDTVVVIDRIRENLGFKKKGETLEAMTTRSIQEVITRSLYTGVSVQMMLISMLIWGGESLWDMSMTLLIGITAGTYSSIFIASALWLFFQQWKGTGKKPTVGKPVRA